MIIGCAINMNAQSFQIHTGPAFPIGNFADNNKKNDNAGYANTGFNIGIKSYLHLAKSNFSLVFGLDFFRNGIKEWRPSKEMYEVYSHITDFNNRDYPIYLNVPLTVGLNYSYPLSKKKIKIYGEAGVGVNCSMITSFYLDGYYPVYHYSLYQRGYGWAKESLYPAYGLSYNIEGGFLFKWFKLGFRYNYLGNYSYETRMDNNTDYSYYGYIEVENLKRKISNLQLVVGFNF